VDSNAEGFFILAKFMPILDAIREKNPTFMTKTSEMVRRFSSATQRLDAIVKRVEVTRATLAAKSKKRVSKVADVSVDLSGDLPLAVPEFSSEQ
jgi:hypothetical protein